MQILTLPRGGVFFAPRRAASVEATMGFLTINGERREFATGVPATLSELLRQMDIAEATVVAEVDGQIVDRAKFKDTSLRAGQTIELIRFVGGG
jgi:thiamine biosynthesis protein ThiS